MRSSVPPILIDGPDHPHAFDNIPVRGRPAHADIACSHCCGRGAWNEMLHPDSFRCRLAVCRECDGQGWVQIDGGRTMQDIVLVDGRPTWIRRRMPPPPVLASVHPSVGEPADLKLEAA